MPSQPDGLRQDAATTLTADIREAAQRLFALVERRLELVQETQPQVPPLHGRPGAGRPSRPAADTLDGRAS
jgi:hypothetical protein